jgi:hypothetical protein
VSQKSMVRAKIGTAMKNKGNIDEMSQLNATIL